MGHAKTRVSGPETHVYACLRSLSSPYFDLKNQLLYKLVFFCQNMVGKTLRHA